jgi:hypothetical protein
VLVSEAKGANQAQALVLGTGESGSDDDGAANGGAGESDFEDVRHAASEGGARRLRKPYRLHSLVPVRIGTLA